MTFVQVLAVQGSAEGIIAMQGSGTYCKLMLVDGSTLAPLCPAWVSVQ